MTDRSGLFVAPVPGTPPVGTAPTDGRLVLGALFGQAFSVVAGGTVTQSTSSMALTVAATTWQIPDPTNGNAVFLSPSDQIVLTPAVGPSTGSRIDIIQIKQNDYANGDPDSRVKVALKAGVASGSPTQPTPDAGYQLYAVITVPANASNAAACTLRLTAVSTFAPPDIVAPTLALLKTTVGKPGQQAAVTADSNAFNNGLYYSINGSWVPSALGQGLMAWYNTGGGATYHGVSGFLPIFQMGQAIGKTTSGGVLGWSFPTPFPNGVAAVILMPTNTSGPSTPLVVEASVSTSGFQTFWAGAGSTNVNVPYVAIGY